MNTGDKKIAEVLAKFGEPMAGNVWRVQGTAVIYHKTLERIAAQAQIRFDEPKIIRAERDEAVIQVTGHLGDRTEWTIGEALIGVNYRVSGKQAAYVYAIAEKRAKDRVILKLIELHGYMYSEEEAEEFKQSRGRDVLDGPDIVRGQDNQQPDDAPRMDEPEDEIERVGRQVMEQAHGKVEDDLKAKIKKAKTIPAVTDLMLHADTQKLLADLPEGVRDGIRDFAKARLVELGWSAKKDTASKEPGAGRDEGLQEQPPPKPYDKEESLRQANALVKRLARVHHRSALSDWSKEYSRHKPRLQPEDCDRIQGRYERKRDDILAQERA